MCTKRDANDAWVKLDQVAGDKLSIETKIALHDILLRQEDEFVIMTTEGILVCGGEDKELGFLAADYIESVQKIAQRLDYQVPKPVLPTSAKNVQYIS